MFGEEPNNTASPLALTHILLHTLSYASPQTLGRCMAVSSFWYDAAATYLWAHVSYRVNPYLKDPGVTPFLPVPSGEHFRGLRRAKRRAVRYVKVVEMRKHDCGEVGCERMTLHGEESEDEGGNGAREAVRLSSTNHPTNGGLPPAVGDGSSDGFDQAPRYQRPVLAALRLHVDDIRNVTRSIRDEQARPRIVPYPCPFVSQLDTSTLVVVPLRQLSNTRPVPLPSAPSLRKLILLLIPPTQPPGEFRLADTIPSSVNEVVIYLWRRHASSNYDSFRGAWARQMGQRRWGPDKIWGHWSNLILAASPLGFELPADELGEGKRRTRRYTFVGTGGFDPLWLDIADNKWPVFPDSDSGADPALYEPTQRRFEKGMRACLVAKIEERRMRYAGAGSGGREDWDGEVKECLDNIRFLSREDYLAEGRWQGEFTLDEVMYHG